MSKLTHFSGIMAISRSKESKVEEPIEARLEKNSKRLEALWVLTLVCSKLITLQAVSIPVGSPIIPVNSPYVTRLLAWVNLDVTLSCELLVA